jgi:hypothetical protein
VGGNERGDEGAHGEGVEGDEGVADLSAADQTPRDSSVSDDSIIKLGVAEDDSTLSVRTVKRPAEVYDRLCSSMLPSCLTHLM